MKGYNFVIKEYNNSIQIKTYKNVIVGTPKSNGPCDLDFIFTKIRKDFINEIGITDIQSNMNVYKEYFLDAYNNVMKEYIAKKPKKEKKEMEEREINQDNLIRSTKRSVQKIWDIAKSNDWLYFVTLTFDETVIDRYNYDLCKMAITEYLKHLRRIYKQDLYWLGVPELHKDGALHFHFLFGGCEMKNLKDSGHVDKKGRKIYNLTDYTLGFTNITTTDIEDSDKVASYVCKYITEDIKSVKDGNVDKDLFNKLFGKKRYFASKNCKKPVTTKYVIPQQALDKFVDELQKCDIEKYEKSYNYEIPCKNGITENTVTLTEIKKSDLQFLQSFEETKKNDLDNGIPIFDTKIIILRQSGYFFKYPTKSDYDSWDIQFITHLIQFQFQALIYFLPIFLL